MYVGVNDLVKNFDCEHEESALILRFDEIAQSFEYKGKLKYQTEACAYVEFFNPCVYVSGNRNRRVYYLGTLGERGNFKRQSMSEGMALVISVGSEDEEQETPQSGPHQC